MTEQEIKDRVVEMADVIAKALKRGESVEINKPNSNTINVSAVKKKKM